MVDNTFAGTPRVSRDIYRAVEEQYWILGPFIRDKRSGSIYPILGNMPLGKMIGETERKEHEQLEDIVAAHEIQSLKEEFDRHKDSHELVVQIETDPDSILEHIQVYAHERILGKLLESIRRKYPTFPEWELTKPRFDQYRD